MLGETHRRIAREIAKALNLNEREASLLEVGSVGPDSWANFPHHEGKECEIAANILVARKLYVQDDDECFARLGNALHYIQDRWTMRPRLSDKHTKWEESINLAPILDDSQLENAIKQALLPTKAEKAYLSFLEDIAKGLVIIPNEALKQKWESAGFYYIENIPCLPKPPYELPFKISSEYLRPFGAKVICYALQNRPTTWSTPTLDLNVAYRICLEVARNVFSQEHEKEEWTVSEPTTSPEPTPAPPRLETPYRPLGIMFFIFSFILFIIMLAFANAGNPSAFILAVLVAICMSAGIVFYFEKREKWT